jgi:hypothetical protein
MVGEEDSQRSVGEGNYGRRRWKEEEEGKDVGVEEVKKKEEE